MVGPTFQYIKGSFAISLKIPIKFSLNFIGSTALTKKYFFGSGKSIEKIPSPGELHPFGKLIERGYK